MTTTGRAELTSEIESSIRVLHAEGLTQGQIARRLDIARPNISRWSKRLGLLWTDTRTSAASSATRQLLEHKRMQIAERLLADVEAIRERLWEQYEVLMNTPTGPTRMTLDLPDAKAIADISSAVERLVKSHDHLARLGRGVDVDQAKSMLSQMQQQLSTYAASYEEAGSGDQRVTTTPSTSSNTDPIGQTIRSSEEPSHA